MCSVILIICFLLTLLLSPTTLAIENVKSIVVNAEVYPPKLLPGDSADCKLYLYNPNWDSVKVTYVSFDTPSGISVDKSPIFGIGWIPGNSTYELPFIIKAVKPGTYTLKCEISVMHNVTTIKITKFIKIKVEEKYPRLIPVSSLKLGEVSKLDLILETPIPIKKVVVEPLFSVEPSQAYFESVNSYAKLSFKCYINKTEKLAFRISFYNGDNFHTILQEVSPIYRESWGIIVNLSSPLKEIHRSDVVPIFLEINNARADRIHNIKIHITSNGSLLKNEIEIPYLEPNTSKVIVFKYSPPKDRLDDKLIVEIKYKDSMDNSYQVSKSISIKVIPEYTLTLTNINMRDGRVLGDIGNQGYGTVYSVLLHISSEKEEKEYFIGRINPSDIQEFKVKLPGNKIHLTVIWANELGEKFKFTKEVYVGESTQFTQIGYVVLGSVIVFVCVVIGVLYLRRRGEV